MNIFEEKEVEELQTERFNFHVERSSYKRPYQDTEITYKLRNLGDVDYESNDIILNYCLPSLVGDNLPSRETRNNILSDYYTFNKISEKEFVFKVIKPFKD